MIEKLYDAKTLETKAKSLFQAERARKRLDGWLIAKEQYEDVMEREADKPHVIRTALALKQIVSVLPLDIHRDAVFAGTQRDAFARSYALINPAFRVDTFQGYCDPTEVFDSVEPNGEFTEERLAALRGRVEKSPYVQELKRVYDSAGPDMEEVAYFVEQVTGHLIPDFRYVLTHGISGLRQRIGERKELVTEEKKRDQYEAMEISLDALTLLAERYHRLAQESLAGLTGIERQRRQLLVETLEKVPKQGADTLYEAIQSFLLLWQVMCLEQAPNPFAFSVGNADRIFEPYRAKEQLSRELAAGLFEHFLVFYNVGDRSWAISQNIILGGKNEKGEDLTNLTTYSLLDAYYAMNFPQPILSVKLHRNTPEELYRALGRFFFTPGMLTPSLFNDDAVFEVLRESGVEEEDLPDYSVAGCQEPLIMGKDNGNTTNSWLNLAKILELALNDGRSLLTEKQIGPTWEQMGIEGEIEAVLPQIRQVFWQYLTYFTKRMVKMANGASGAVSLLPVPFLSCFMGGVESGIDVRDIHEQGTKYNGSGCLIHGLTVVADSFAAIDELLKAGETDGETLLAALKKDFEGYEKLYSFLMDCPKFGNNQRVVDEEAARIAGEVSALVRSQKNYLGNPFRPDYSTPSTHLIYGNLVGALPSGRKAREMLNYGVDPLYGEASAGLGFRVLSTRKLPFETFCGGYASHLGLDPKYFKGADDEARGLEFRDKIVKTLFFYDKGQFISPFYLYVNVTTPDMLRKVLAEPKKYAPSGVYIMRIHGTFVNFLDLSPEIQNDIIKRLDLESTRC